MPHKCEMCQISFSRKSRLTNHLKLKHGNQAKQEGSKLRKCPFCEIKYRDKKELLLHVNSNHKESRVFSKRRGAIGDKVCIFQQERTHLKSPLQLEANDRECFQSLKKSIYTSGGLSDKYNNHGGLRDTGFRRRESGKKRRHRFFHVKVERRRG